MNHKTIISFLIIAIVFVTEMASDIYQPCMPTLRDHFCVSEKIVQFTMAINILGFTISGLFYGPLSDSFGRRPILLAGFSVFALGTTLNILAPDINFLIVTRFLQGLGAGASVIGLSMVMDIFDEKESVRFMSIMGSVISLSPGIAPIIGNYIDMQWGWQYTFYFTAVLTFIIWVAASWYIPETHPGPLTRRFEWRKLVREYRIIFTSPAYLRYAVISGLVYGGIWSMVIAFPFVLLDILKLDRSYYGFVNFLGVITYIAGAIRNRHLILTHTSHHLLHWGTKIILVSAGLALVNCFWISDSLWLFRFWTCVYCYGMGFIFSNSAALTMQVFPESRGIASSALITIEMGSAFIFMVLTGHTLMPVCLLITMTALLCFLLIPRQKLNAIH